MENTLALGAPAASVSSVTRLPQQDVFHAIVDVACWKHNETSMSPNCTSPGTKAALWDLVGGDTGSGENLTVAFALTAKNFTVKKAKTKGSSVDIYWPSGYFLVIKPLLMNFS